MESRILELLMSMDCSLFQWRRQSHQQVCNHPPPPHPHPPVKSGPLVFFTGKWQGVCTGLCPRGEIVAFRSSSIDPNPGIAFSNEGKTPANKHVNACLNKSEPKCAQAADALTHFPDAISCLSFISEGNFPSHHFTKTLAFKPLWVVLFILC